jgi:branched-chain amino acid transport system permease protein
MNEILVQTIISGIITGLVYGLVAAGLNVIYGMMDIINFSHGESLMLNMYLAFFLFTLVGIDPLYALPICLLFSFSLGIITYQVLIRPILKATMLVQVVVTFGLAIFLRSTAQFLWSPDYRTIRNPMVTGMLNLGGIYLPKPQVVAALVCLLAYAFLYVLMTHTELGVAFKATAEDKEAASLMGINSNRMFALAWGIGIGCVGVAGGLLSTFYYIFPEVGLPFSLLAYVVVAVGGFGSVFGTLVGGLIIGLVEVVGGYLFIPSFKYALVFAIYLIVVFTRPQGLFGRF